MQKNLKNSAYSIKYAYEIYKINFDIKDTIDITLRLNAFDAIPFPYGCRVDKENFHKPDLTEPIKLVKLLNSKGAKLVNISCGNPYYNPHVGRQSFAYPDFARDIFEKGKKNRKKCCIACSKCTEIMRDGGKTG